VQNAEFCQGCPEHAVLPKPHNDSPTLLPSVLTEWEGLYPG
jgi:hypothetical protein